MTTNTSDLHPSAAPSLREVCQAADVILFDLDSTLTDHRAAMTKAFAHWATTGGYPADLERWAAIERKWFAAFERGEISHPEQRLARVREYLHDPDMPEAQARAIFQVFLDAYAQATTAYPDAAAALAWALKTVATVGIFTNGAADIQTLKLQQAGLWDDRLHMFATKELGFAKPRPESYQAVLANLDVAPARVLVIGDSQANDVLGSIDAGMQAIHLDRSATAAHYDPRGFWIIPELSLLHTLA